MTYKKNLEATEKSKIIVDAYDNLKNYTSFSIEDTAGRIRVKSSNIYSVGYNSKEMILQIQFLNGVVYEYYGIPKSLFNDFMTAKSKGKFAIRYIYYSYRYERVE
jgi:citrate synthase